VVVALAAFVAVKTISKSLEATERPWRPVKSKATVIGCAAAPTTMCAE
jgi:hypothetical protein